MQVFGQLKKRKKNAIVGYSFSQLAVRDGNRTILIEC